MEKKIVGKKKARVDRKLCVACGNCVRACPRAALSVWKGLHAVVEDERCIGCGICRKECPASIISIEIIEANEQSWCSLQG